MNIGQGTTDASNPLQSIQHRQEYSPADLDSTEGNLIRNTKSVLNELNSLKELTGEETMSHKSEYGQMDVHNN
jgi:hypothetical protein